jgi:hypothetical protein
MTGLMRVTLEILMKPAALSREWRSGSGRFLQLRRKSLVLSLIGAGAMMPISLYQMGVIQHLPEPPLPKLNADAVDAAPEAYQYLSTPDALLGLVSYSATAWLASMGGENRPQTQPWLPLVLAGLMCELRDCAVRHSRGEGRSRYEEQTDVTPCCRDAVMPILETFAYELVTTANRDCRCIT